MRINDRIAELELQVEPLREQAERAKRFLILRDELRLLEISVWLDKLEEIRAGTIKLQADCAAARAENDRANGELERLYSENEAFAGKLQDNDLEQERVREEASPAGGAGRRRGQRRGGAPGHHPAQPLLHRHAGAGDGGPGQPQPVHPGADGGSEPPHRGHRRQGRRPGA